MGDVLRDYFVAPTAIVESGAEIGEGTKIWHHTQVRSGAKIGKNCVIGKGCFIDTGVVIGDNCKIQNSCNLYQGLTLEDGVFVGPNVQFTNDLYPRAINPDGSPKSLADWVVTPTLVETGAAIGTNSTIVCGVTIGRWSMIAAGAVVTKDVAQFTLVAGVPAKQKWFVCPCGKQVSGLSCEHCGKPVEFLH